MLKYSKVREVIDPVRSTKKSAGIDFYIPKMHAEYLFQVAILNKKHLENDMIYIDSNNKTIILAPGAHILLPSGIKMNLVEVENGTLIDKSGVALVAMNRSSVAKDDQLVAGATVVDEDYQGEIHISLINSSNRLIKLKEDKKVLQFLLMPVLMYDLTSVSTVELYSSKTERGENGFGHTGQ